MYRYSAYLHLISLDVFGRFALLLCLPKCSVRTSLDKVWTKIILILILVNSILAFAISIASAVGSYVIGYLSDIFDINNHPKA